MTKRLCQTKWIGYVFHGPAELMTPPYLRLPSSASRPNTSCLCGPSSKLCMQTCPSLQLLAQILLVCAGLLQNFVCRLVLLFSSDLASLDTESRLGHRDNLFQCVLGDILELRLWCVALLNTLLTRAAREDQQFRLVQLETADILLETLCAPVSAAVIHGNANGASELWCNLRLT